MKKKVFYFDNNFLNKKGWPENLQ